MSGARPFPRARAATVLFVLACVAGIAVSGPSLAEDRSDEVLAARSYEVRFRALTDAVDLVTAVLSEKGEVSLQPRLKRIVVQDVPAVLDRVEQVLRDYDVPPRNVEVSISLFLGTDRRDDEAGRLGRPPAVAEETRGIRETLGDFTKWTEFAPLGSRTITCLEGYAGSAYLAEDFRVEFHIDSVQGGERVTFDRFTLMKMVPTADGGERSVKHYDAAIHLPVDQELLVGAASGPDASAALFLKLLVKVR